ncbi:MAG TPA: hypothetical protein VFA18_00240 [Gemmataceae bacterium]|nr:hypothetical protein [Gemmataceae bacterium]
MFRRFSWLSVPVVRLALASSSILALGIPWGRGGDLNDGFDALETDYRKSKATIQKLFQGKEVFDSKNPQHEKALDVAAQNATYYYSHPRSEKTGEIERLITSFESEMNSLDKAKATSPALPAMYSRRVIFRGQEVLHSPGKDIKPIARVNVTRVMARLAQRGPTESSEDVVARLRGPAATELADAMIKALDVKNDGVKYHALHGLQGLLELPPQTPPLLSPEVEEQCVLRLIAFIQQPPTYHASASSEEIEGFKVLRREAIKALAQYPAPSIKDKARPALVLLKVVARDGLRPEPRMDERVEAAIGVARIKPDGDPSYQRDYAAQQLGLFLVDFAYRYNNRDRDELKPWAVQAARLSDALEVMKATSKSPYVAKVVDDGIKLVLRRIEAKNDVNANEVTDYNSLLSKPPALGQLFSGVDGTAVPPPNRKEDEPAKQ